MICLTKEQAMVSCGIDDELFPTRYPKGVTADVPVEILGAFIVCKDKDTLFSIKAA